MNQLSSELAPEYQCPVGRTVHVLAIPTKPPPGVLVAGENQVQVQIQKVQDNHHEFELHYDKDKGWKFCCKFCLRTNEGSRLAL